MSEQIENQEDGEAVPKVDELASLKQRADFLGVQYHPSIGLEKLRAKVAAAIDGKPDPDAQDTKVQVHEDKSVETENERRYRLKREANRLVRVNVTCLNPAKREWPGEIFTIGNTMIGTLRKFVPFNTTDGWHVPEAILRMMEDRECQIFQNKNVMVGGREQKVREGKMIKEFAIQRLPALTEDQLKELARRQAMAAGQTV